MKSLAPFVLTASAFALAACGGTEPETEAVGDYDRTSAATNDVAPIYRDSDETAILGAYDAIANDADDSDLDDNDLDTAELDDDDADLLDDEDDDLDTGYVDVDGVDTDYSLEPK